MPITRQKIGGGVSAYSGLTGVPIAGYEQILADCENTTNEVDIYSVIIPANSYLDGELIEIALDIEAYNATGGSKSIDLYTYINGVKHSQNLGGFLNDSTNSHQYAALFAKRTGSDLYLMGALNDSYGSNGSSYDAISNIQNWDTGSSIFTNAKTQKATSHDFTADTTIKNIMPLNAASADYYLRVHGARTIKYNQL